MRDFVMFVERVLEHERGWVDNPRDPGGETNLGITWPILRKAIKLGIVPNTTTIRNITRPQAVSIYEEFFWKEPNYDQLPSAIAFQVFDAGTNHGNENASRWLQRAVGVADDGVIGPVTVRAVNEAFTTNSWELLVKFWEIRIGFYTKLTNFNNFGRGWINRMVENMKHARGDL